MKIPDPTKVSIGLSTIAGFVLALVAALVPFLGELSDATAPLGVNPDLWLKIATVLVVVTIGGRMLQAVAQVIAQFFDGSSEPDDLGPPASREGELAAGIPAPSERTETLQDVGNDPPGT